MKWSSRVYLLFILLFTLNVYAGNAYVWEDEHGVVHFSDFPQDSTAQTISLPDYDAAAPDPKFEESVPINPPTEESVIEKKPIPLPELTIDIIHPTQEQTIRSNKGEINIEIKLNRMLKVSEHLQLLMNNKPYGAPTTQPRWELKNIDRGTHLFMIQALTNGKIIASSKVVTVHLHRASVN